MDTPAALPAWAAGLVELYESGASSQFVLHGNVGDVFLVPDRRGGGSDQALAEGDLKGFLTDVLLAPFDVVLIYDLGRGLRVARGAETVEAWPSFGRYGGFPHAPREAVAFIGHFLRYAANLARTTDRSVRPAVVLQSASLVLPVVNGTPSYDLGAMALQVRGWSDEPAVLANGTATFLTTENLNDLNPLLVNNSRAAQVEVPLPDAASLGAALRHWRRLYPGALSGFDDLDLVARPLAGTSLGAVAALLKRREHARDPLGPGDLAELKRELVERDCNGLIGFVEPDRTLDDVYGNDAIKAWLRQDVALWHQGDLRALPMGYLFCGPVGTGKTFLVECLAGEAGVPVVVLKNFRDRWVGSTESNLEKIFRLLHALGRCIVFIDEADQALGRRSGGSGDSGVSGRVYSMMAKEMSRTSNRGKILWVLASSRPDLIEVDLKRPGRIDVKIPIFPAPTPGEGYALIRALCRKFDLALPEPPPDDLLALVPPGVTASAAEALAVKVYRTSKTAGLDPAAALRDSLDDYQNPVPQDVMDFQIEIAAREASDLTFIPEAYRLEV